MSWQVKKYKIGITKVIDRTPLGAYFSLSIAGEYGFSKAQMNDWNADDYERFAPQRQRAARDLLAAVPVRDARVISDLGCGSGLSTQLLCKRWPRAAVTGIDFSPAMLQRARQRCPQARFVVADIASYRCPEPPDLIFANASLHWLDGHRQLLPRLFGELRPGGVLALQMPDNLREPSHVLMRRIAAQAEFAQDLAALSGARAHLLDIQDYYDCLATEAAALAIWRTAYVHPMRSAQAIADWFATTGLKPYLDALSEERRGIYLERYVRELGVAYPPRRDARVLLTLPRLFVVATRAA